MTLTYRRISMRLWLVVTTMAVTVLGWAGGALAGDGGSFETIFTQKLAPAFEKKFNARANFISGNSTETVARVQAQKDNPQIDATFVDDGPAYQGQALRLWEPIDPKIVTNLADLYDIARHRDGVGDGIRR
jgi:putative spermidine/putrescine transport system substrate-binding protein